MPISPENRKRYPSDWKAISRRIREREGNACKWCGAVNGQPNPATGSKVVLTVAHINHVVEDVSEANLAALCQRCHLRHDAKEHARNAQRTIRSRKAWREMF